MFWTVRKGYVFRGKRELDTFKEGQTIDDRAVEIKGQEYKLEPSKEQPKQSEAKNGAGTEVPAGAKQAGKSATGIPTGIESDAESRSS
jgi:hypothetical protein